MSEPIEISFVVPAYNEEEGVEDTLRRLQVALEKCKAKFEIILVNDGSTDRTELMAQKVAGVKIISHPVSIGYGNSLKHGIREARCEWIGIIDADGSYNIEGMDHLLAHLQRGYDMVVASRKNIDQIDSFTKRIFRRLFKLAVWLLNDSRIEDPNSGFRIFRRRLALELQPFLCGTFSFTSSLSILASGLDYFIAYVPLPYQRRTGNSKVRHFRDTLRTMQYLVQGIIFFNPIKFFLLLSLITLLFVAIPAIGLAVSGHLYIAFGYLMVGLASGLFLGMAGLGDIIRVSLMKK